jgi:hypothetical protein
MEHFRCGLSPTKNCHRQNLAWTPTVEWTCDCFDSLSSCTLQRGSVSRLFAILRRLHASWAAGVQRSGYNLLKAPPQLTDTQTSTTVEALTQWRMRDALFKNPKGDNRTTNSRKHTPSSEANSFSASQEIPELYRNRRFTAAFTTAYHLYVSWTRVIQWKPHSAYWRSTLMLSSHLRLCHPSGPLRLDSPTKTTRVFLFSPHMPHVPPISPPQKICGEECQSWNFCLYIFLVSK